MSDDATLRETPRLIADIGGTNLRFALQTPGREPTDVRSCPASEHKSLAHAANDYLETANPSVRPRKAAFAIAAPIVGDHVEMTNREWSFSRDELRKKIGLESLHVINDFAALAYAAPGLRAADVRRIGGGAPAEGAPIGLIGPGTGLGASVLLFDRGRPVALESEGGHATMAPADEKEAEVLNWLRRRIGHVSAERVVSGQGLVNLHAALRALHGLPETAIEPEEITAAALDGSSPVACEVVEMFSAMLGTVAGNLALTIGGRGGILIAGGIVPKLGPAFADARFRERFEDKGRFQDYLAAIPTSVIIAETPTLAGLAALLDLD